MTQYVDKLNIKFIQMDRDKRENNISIFAKRLAEKDHRYIQVFRKIHQVAHENGVHPTN